MTMPSNKDEPVKMYRGRFFENCITRAEEQDSEYLRIAGKAVTFETPAVLFTYGGEEYKEIIDRNAFVGCDMSDAVLTLNHDFSHGLLARSKNNTLSLSAGSEYLNFTADIIDNNLGRDVYKQIQRGDLSQCSFGAEVGESSYDSATHTRRILRFSKLFDVSVVTFPAYDDTSVMALRDKFLAMEQGKQDKELELAKKKLVAKL